MQQGCQLYIPAAFTPPFPTEDTAGTHFCYRLSRPRGHSTTGRIVNKKRQWPHRKSNPGLSDLYRSVYAEVNRRNVFLLNTISWVLV